MRISFGRLVAIVALATLTSAQPASAQLGFTIDPTQGFPGDTVNGQVDPATVAANCTTTVEGLSAVFTDLFVGPFVSSDTEGELPQRFFPDPENIVYENSSQLSYVLTLLVVLGISQNINDAAVGALPQTFVMTFADIATQEPIGPLGNFDPTTGVGSTIVPDLPPSLQAVVATCVTPTFDIDALEQGIIEGGQFLDSIGVQFGPEGPVSPEFEAFAQQFLGTTSTGFELLIEFVQAVGPSLLQPIMVPQAVGLQFFEILPPAPINIQTANVWRTRTKPGRIMIKGNLLTGQFGPNDAIVPPSDFSIRVTDGLNLDVVVDVAASSCAVKPNGAVICQNAAKTYRVRFMPVKKTPGQYKYDIKLTNLDISAPQIGPVTLDMELGIPRAGTAGNCRVDNAKLTCRG